VNILLDTHTLLWAIGQSNELSKKVIKEIENTDNEIFVSAVSLWEIALKSSVGKLKLSFSVANIADYCKKMEFTLLPLEPWML